MYRKLIVLIIASFFSSYLNAQENSLYYYGYKTKYVLTTDVITLCFDSQR
ncbi:hypothetical protein [Cecembia rubra]|nr:hypothetical protein [Cecembia rubra]